MNHILEQVQSGDFDPVKMFTGNKDKFLEVKTAIESISNNLTKETCIEFLLTKIIPTAFNKSISHAARDEAVEIGFHLLKFVNISILSTKEQENIFNAIEETYAKTIGDLRDNNYSNWDRLWIFLIRLCHEKLHTKMSLANKLLRVVEVAFRNSTSIEQRLKAYDCWMELIDNCSLNMDYMCSAKQIKLLMTPMKAKFSRMPVVIMKRCDTFVYLLEKLQDKATLCLKEFLEFCFGPFEEKNDVEKMRQGKSVPEVCIKSTKVLIEIIGHSHNDLENCIQSDDIQLQKPIINNGNFPDFTEILINSTVECCILLDEWNKDSSSSNVIIKCLWRSLLQLIHQSSNDVIKRCCGQINNSLQKLLGRSEYNKHFHVILGNVLELLIKDQMVESLREILFNIAMNLLRHFPIDPCSFNVEEVLNFIESCFEAENGSKYAKIASNYFKSDAKCVNSNTLCEVWLKCNITVTSGNISNVIWPIRHLQNFKDAKALNLKWTKLYNTECKSEAMKFSIMQEMEKLFLENPLLSSNIISFLQLISSAETNSSKDFVCDNKWNVCRNLNFEITTSGVVIVSLLRWFNPRLDICICIQPRMKIIESQVAKFMRLIELVLTLPNLSDTDIKKLSSIVLAYCDQNNFFYKSESNDEALDKLCGCLEHIVTIHKDYVVLTELAACLKEGQPKILLKFSKRLMSFLEGLMLNEDNADENNTRKLIELLEIKENESESIPLASTRSLRIVNMANINPKSSKLGDQVNNLRLFGKSVDAPSPLALKGSKLGSTPRGKRQNENKNKKQAAVPINDDKSSDYVRVDTEVKIDVNNLNEHQKEVLKKRREDIPALYQDLTQSLSHTQDFFTNSNDIKIDETSEGSKENLTISDASPSSSLPIIEENKKDSSASRKKKRKNEDESLNEHKKSKIAKLSSDDTTQKIEESTSLTEDKEKEIVVDESVTETKSSDIIEEYVTKTFDTTPSDQEEKISEENKEIEHESVQRSLRKSTRQAKRRQSEIKKDKDQRNHNSSNKQEENGNTVKENENATLQLNLKITEGKMMEEDVNTSNEEVKHPEEIEENVHERSIRKSARQMKRRQEYVTTEQKKRKNKTEKVQLEQDKNEENNHKKSHENDMTNIEEKNDDNSVLKQEENELVENSLRKSKRRIKRQQEEIETPEKSVEEKKNEQSENQKDDDVESMNESIEDLLARVDKRIEDNKRTEQVKVVEELRRKSKRTPKKERQSVERHLNDVWNETLPDGNQNKIVSLNTSTPEERNKHSKKHKMNKLDLKAASIQESSDDDENQTSSDKSGDVYEFTGDDDFVVEDLKKSSKKKKKRLYLNRHDYISKRRKKTKKDVKEDGELVFPFHVTADCTAPLPLSKSQSLRAVPSPQESETITIVITRSPPESEKGSKEDKESPQSVDTDLGDESKSLSPRRRPRRRLVSPEVPANPVNSEDVIESSQATVNINLSKRRSSSRNKSRPLKNITEETVAETVKISPPVEVNANLSKRRTRSSSSDSKNSSSDDLTKILTLETGKKESYEKKENVNETVSPKMKKPRRLSLIETPRVKTKPMKRHKRSKSLDKLNLDLEITFLTDEMKKMGSVSKHIVEDLADTETVPFDSENLPDTLSPVENKAKDDLPGSPVTCDTPDRTTELLNNTSDISPINSGEETTVTPKTKYPPNEVTNLRVARLLQMVNSNVQVSNTGRRWFGNKHSPSSSRVRKMRMKKEENLDILTFSREVPSPLTVPASGILKRKFNNFEETGTPSPKRKRVNFSDPAITDKKIFIKDVEEYETNCDNDQNTDSTKESPETMEDLFDEATDKGENLGKLFLDKMDKEELIFTIKEFCDSKLKDISLDNSHFKSALKCLIQNLNIPEIMEVISEYLTNLENANATTMNDIALIDRGTAEQVVDECVVPLIQNLDVFEVFLPKLLDVLQNLTDEKLRCFISEIMRVFGENRINNVTKEELMQQQIEDHIVNKFDCDKMNELIKKYFLNMEDQKRNEFLVNLMNLASSELPVSKEFVSCHVNMLQNFVKRMSD